MSTKRKTNRRRKSYDFEESDVAFKGEEKEFLSILLNNIKPIKPKTNNQKKFLKLIEEKDLTICVGEAGCGKTLLACFQALNLLKTDSRFKRILLIKSITELKNESIGTLPGDKNEKIFLAMLSFMDSFYKLIGEKNTKQLIDQGIIIFEPIAYVRGRDFSESIVLVDETQNITKDNLKTLLTRFSENSKYIIIGDTEQIDIKHKSESSLEFIYNKIINNICSEVGTIKFEEEDIVRHKLTSYFLSLFK